MSTLSPVYAIPAPQLDDAANIETAVVPLRDRIEALFIGGRATRDVLDTGQVGQTRAGRTLTVADFTTLGLSSPLALWNLSALTDASPNARTLTNKGAVPFGIGVEGAAASAAVFAGSTGQALYVADSGAGDPLRLKTGSWGCWFRTAKRGAAQVLVAKYGASGTFGWSLYVNTANVLQAAASSNGTSGAAPLGSSDVADDRWHFGVATYDGGAARLYVDGVLEATDGAVSGPLFQTATAVNVGANGADAATAAGNPHFGRVDEAFVTADVLSEDQVRMLYAVKIAHGFAQNPRTADTQVRRRRRGAVLASADFPAAPRRLHNLLTAAGTDLGANALPLTFNTGTGSVTSVAGPDGAAASAAQLVGAHAGYSASDAGLPAGTSSRSYGLWLKTTAPTSTALLVWGASPAVTDARLYIGNTGGQITSANGADLATGPSVTDGAWHHVVAVEDATAPDGVKRKLYVDGRLVTSSLVLNSVTLGGATTFRVGANQDGSAPFAGTVARAFVYAGALTPDQILGLYARGSQPLPVSPRDAGHLIEGMDATNLYVIADTIDAQHQLDVRAAA